MTGTRMDCRRPTLRIVAVAMALWAGAAHAQTFSVVYTFTGGNNGYPYGGVVPDAAGNLYGTAGSAGGPTCCGVAYKVDPAGQETILNTFSSFADGEFPYGTLVPDSRGNLYGTTPEGGIPGSCNGGGCGTVFKVSPAGQETVLYSFTGAADGDGPSDGPGGGLARDSAGNLYGTTMYGGDFDGACTGTGCGVVYKIDATGKYSVLYAFNGGADGAYPKSGVVLDATGNLYGGTYGGGQDLCYGDGSGCGVVYKLDSSGNETVLYSFAGRADGAQPYGPLTVDSAGNVYGTAEIGGASGGSCSYKYGCGIVFKLSPTGAETVLYTFSGGADGDAPATGVIRDPAGNLYGTTIGGGSYGYGAVFRLGATGQESVLHSFTSGADGESPWGRLLAYRGYLYGTTAAGGKAQGGAGAGVVYRLTFP
jgi:uncharacterized repeat protein (TIGR03803 family)